MTADAADAATQLMHSAVPILASMGITAIEATPSRASVRLEHEPNRNHIGTTYAGALFSAAEVLGGLIGLAQEIEGAVPILKHFEIDFLRPASTAVIATVELDDATRAGLRAAVERDGKASFVLEASLVDEAGVEVARTRGDYQLRRF